MVTTSRTEPVRRTRWHIMAACLFGITMWPQSASGQCKPVVLQSATQSADLFVLTSDGTCTLAAADDGGYIKTNTIYKLHIAAMVGGVCQARAYQYPPGGCVNSITQYRTIGTSTLSVDGVTSGSVAVNPSNTQTIQSYDTRVPTNTLNTGSSYSTNTLGAHAFTSSTNATITSCSFTPTSFPQNQSITVNALKCEPVFDRLDSQGNTVPMDRVAVPTSPDKIDVYLPSTMSGASTALGSAISKWNSQVVATGVQFQQVGSSCGTGPRCITVEVASIGSCGFSAWDPPDHSGHNARGAQTPVHQHLDGFHSRKP